MTGQRLPHGYTNDTRGLGSVVEKRYRGADARERFDREREALAAVAGIVATPRIIGADASVPLLRLERVDGMNGQALIESFPREILDALGHTARRLHGSDAGPVRLHGDFGPHNCLFALDASRVTAVVDWEHSRLGDPVEDLAWAEWIVRTHHPTQVGALGHLYGAYGRQWPWERRRQAMVDRCRFLVAAADTREVTEIWSQRLERTGSWNEGLPVQDGGG